MFFLLRFLNSNGNKWWVRAGALILIAGLIALRVTASRSHSSWSETAVVVIVIAAIGARLLMVRRGIGGPVPGGRRAEQGRSGVPLEQGGLPFDSGPRQPGPQ